MLHVLDIPSGLLQGGIDGVPSLFFRRQRHRQPLTPQSHRFQSRPKIILHFPLDRNEKTRSGEAWERMIRVPW
jgi:hypothetical protein